MMPCPVCREYSFLKMEVALERQYPILFENHNSSDVVFLPIFFCLAIQFFPFGNFIVWNLALRGAMSSAVICRFYGSNYPTFSFYDSY